MKKRKLVQKSYRIEDRLLEEVELEVEVRKANGIEPSSQNGVVNEALRFYFDDRRKNPPLRKVS